MHFLFSFLSFCFDILSFCLLLFLLNNLFVHDSDLSTHIFMTFQLGFLQLNELFFVFCLPIPGRENRMYNVICPIAAKRTSLLQIIGGDGAFYSTGVASLRRFLVAEKLTSMLAKMFFIL